MTTKKPVKLPRRKIVTVEVGSHNVYPTLTMRQAAILLECVKDGMEQGQWVGGVWVDANEWRDLIRALFRPR